MAHDIQSVGHLFYNAFSLQTCEREFMSISDFEEQVLTYLWRGLVLAGLLTVLWSTLAPAPSQTQQQGATNTASSKVNRPSAANEAR